MSSEKLAHVGIVAADGDKMANFFAKHLGGVIESKTEYAELQQISTMVRIGECCLEIMEGTSPSGVVGKFLEKHGAGLHHISLEVNDLNTLVSQLENAGILLIGKDLENPTVHVAFISPKATGGVLVEMYEYL